MLRSNKFLALIFSLLPSFVFAQGAPTGPTLSAVASSIVIGTTAITSGTTTRVLYDNAGVIGEYTISGTGSVAMTTSPTFATPTLGAATATSINKLTLTAPATAATLTLTNNKTFAVTNTLTLSGTDSTTMTFPTTSATIARTDAGQTFTGTNIFGITQVTSLALGGATIGSNALAVTGTSTFSGAISSSSSVTSGEVAALVRSSVALTNLAGASVATLVNSPVVGQPSYWFPIYINGNRYVIPAWSF